MRLEMQRQAAAQAAAAAEAKRQEENRQLAMELGNAVENLDRIGFISTIPVLAQIAKEGGRGLENRLLGCAQTECELPEITCRLLSHVVSQCVMDHLLQKLLGDDYKENGKLETVVKALKTHNMAAGLLKLCLHQQPTSKNPLIEPLIVQLRRAHYEHDAVVITGRLANPVYDGCDAHVLSFDGATGRYKVETARGDRLVLKEANLVAKASAPSASAAPPAFAAPPAPASPTRAAQPKRGPGTPGTDVRKRQRCAAPRRRSLPGSNRARTGASSSMATTSGGTGVFRLP